MMQVQAGEAAGRSHTTVAPCVQKVKLKHEKYERTQIELLEIKPIMSGIQSARPGINSISDVAEENARKREDAAVETIRHETHRTVSIKQRKEHQGTVGNFRQWSFNFLMHVELKSRGEKRMWRKPTSKGQ